MNNWLNKVQNLPVTPFLDDISSALFNSPSGFLILTAQTAAGKSTVVPPSLLNKTSGKILVLEPRRLAAVAVAERISSVLGEETGETCGYRVHLESKISRKTRIEIITEAVLIRKMQKDSLIEDTGIVILDEFHERSIHSDLALAFLKEIMQIRTDLRVIIMSATMDTDALASYIDGNQTDSKAEHTPVLKIPGRQFPVDIIYEPELTVSQAVMKVLAAKERTFGKPSDKSSCSGNSILVFLPGIYEINKVRTELESRLEGINAEILILHSSISLKEQRKILSEPEPNSPVRIILSSSIAETSLTVPSVTTVIDAGFSRLNRMNPALGMEHLVTERESEFSADQRAGRAGRTAPGKCIRLWNKLEVLPKTSVPEILRTDLAPLVLECAEWGAVSSSQLSWLDSPQQNLWNSASQLLERLGCTKDRKITEKGKNVLFLGIHPRHACTAIYGYECNHTEDSVEYVIRLSAFGRAAESLQRLFKENLKSRLDSLNIKKSERRFSKTEMLLSGFPDRLGKKTDSSDSDDSGRNRTKYQFPSGRIAFLDKLPNCASEWIVAPSVDAGERTGKIFLYEELPEDEVSEWLSSRLETSEHIEIPDFNKNKSFRLKKKRIISYGGIILNETNIQPSADDFGKALCGEIKRSGISCLPLNKNSQSLLLRAEFYGERKSDDMIKKLSELADTASQWLTPFITGNSLSEENIHDALYWHLDGNTIDREVPSQITLPNGKKRRISYCKTENADKDGHKIHPELEIIIQQIFGCFETPRILGTPVLLKLLSPAGRPLQITEDLSGFWKNTWHQICKEMKGRYPKHNWNYTSPEKED